MSGEDVEEDASDGAALEVLSDDGLLAQPSHEPSLVSDGNQSPVEEDALAVEEHEWQGVEDGRQRRLEGQEHHHTLFEPRSLAHPMLRAPARANSARAMSAPGPFAGVDISGHTHIQSAGPENSSKHTHKQSGAREAAAREDGSKHGNNTEEDAPKVPQTASHNPKGQVPPACDEDGRRRRDAQDAGGGLDEEAQRGSQREAQRGQAPNSTHLEDAGHAAHTRGHSAAQVRPDQARQIIAEADAEEGGEAGARLQTASCAALADKGVVGLLDLVVQGGPRHEEPLPLDGEGVPRGGAGAGAGAGAGGEVLQEKHALEQPGGSPLLDDRWRDELSLDTSLALSLPRHAHDTCSCRQPWSCLRGLQPPAYRKSELCSMRTALAVLRCMRRDTRCGHAMLTRAPVSRARGHAETSSGAGERRVACVARPPHTARAPHAAHAACVACTDK
jgi:hypothetical protein